MDFNQNIIQFSDSTIKSFFTTVDGNKCYWIFRNIYKHDLKMSRMITNYYSNVIAILEKENYKIVLEKLLLKSFYYNFGFIKLRKCNPKISVSTFNILMENIKHR